MQVLFRELTLEDIPSVKDLTKKSWEGEDYIQSAIKSWIERRDCFTYGAFYKDQLIGLGNIQWMNSQLVWLQGVRVSPHLQRQGIGTELFNFGCENAVDQGARVIQYSTGIRNIASQKIGKKLGFVEKAQMAFLWSSPEDSIINLENTEEIKQIPLDRVLKVIKKIPNGPKNEICIGWTFVPPELEYLRRGDQQRGEWYKNKEAILLELSKGIDPEGENPNNEVWLVLYGLELDSRALLARLLHLHSQRKEIHYIGVFCPKKLAPLAQELGFKYWNEEYSAVVLFEKKCS
ncbi:MAG: GNAT family N-acetyltransferase [Promethearchaeota archaeon]